MTPAYTRATLRDLLPSMVVAPRSPDRVAWRVRYWGPEGDAEAVLLRAGIYWRYTAMEAAAAAMADHGDALPPGFLTVDHPHDDPGAGSVRTVTNPATG